MNDTPTAPTDMPPTAPAAPTRPEWLPEAHWDGEKNAIADNFGAHYGELATFHKSTTEAQQALAARKPDDIKIEVLLPDTVKVPDGMELKIDANDPRVPALRELAIKEGLSQQAVNAIVAFEAQLNIQNHAAEMARIAAEDAKLGANAKDRKAAVGNWLKGMKDRGDLTAGEYEAVRFYADDAAAVTALEKIIAKATGTVPGNTGNNPPQRELPKDPGTRIWGDQAFKANPQAKAS